MLSIAMWQICVFAFKRKVTEAIYYDKVAKWKQNIWSDKFKYINPYKLLLNFDKEINGKIFISCDALTEIGWHGQKPGK